MIISRKNKNNFKKFIATILAVLLVFAGSPQVALALPTPPPAPTAPPAPENTQTPAPAPTLPPEPTSPPPAPTLPPAPSWTSTPTPQAEELVSPSETPTPQASSQNNSEEPETEVAATNSGGSGGQSSDGGSGASVVTGNATNTASIVTDGNNNLSDGSAGECSTCPGGVSVVNGENGSDSTNSGSVGVVDDNSTTQVNGATVVNDLTQTTVSGDNSASRNTGGENAVISGDANTTGTIVNSINTNLSGVTVYEFNIADDQIGDYILDFSEENCVSGCAGDDISAGNIGNGSDSTNTTDVSTLTNDNTFQTNEATIENNMTLLSDSGYNEADRNTDGDNSVTSGDANVSANVLNFANNNVEGGVVYAVVNIFGNLIGDIIFPDGTAWECCGGDITAQNSGNGSDSTNTSNVNETTNNNLSQFNNAEIDNNLVFSATTGDNEISDNTGGSNKVKTGDSSVIGQAVNFVNNNIAGGNWWLVIVNEGGRWIGRIVGAEEDASISGSSGFEFFIDENGEIFVSNTDNGSGSTNTGNVSQTTNNNVTQTNDAQIVNNLNLSANTGKNSTSRNTTGNNSIVTGDAQIIANIVNFMNNNIVGSGKLFVTVINVFGGWFGDFVGPGQEKVEQNSSVGGDPAVGGSDFTSSASNTDSESVASVQTTNSTPKLTGGSILSIAQVTPQSLFAGLTTIGGGVSDTGSNSEVAGDSSKGEIYVNLALPLIALIILGGLYLVLKKKKLVSLKLLPR